MVMRKAMLKVTNYRRAFVGNNYRDVMNIYETARKEQEQRLARPDPAAGMTLEEMDEIVKEILGPDKKK